MRRRALALILIVPLVLAVATLIAGFWYTQSLPSVYSSESRVGFFPVDRKAGSIAGSETVVLTANNFLSVTESSKAIATTAELADVPLETVSDGLSATIPPGSATITITAETESSKDAAGVANAMSKVLIEAVKDDSIVTAVKLSGGVPEAEPSGPPRTILLALSMATSLVVFVFLLGAIVAWLRLRAGGGFSAFLETAMSPDRDVQAPDPTAEVVSDGRD